jgi:hypothetical protein
VIRYHRLPAPVVWIEHHLPIATDGSTETFELSRTEKITLSFAYTYGQQPPEDEYLGPMS